MMTVSVAETGGGGGGGKPEFAYTVGRVQVDIGPSAFLITSHTLWTGWWDWKEGHGLSGFGFYVSRRVPDAPNILRGKNQLWCQKH